MEVAYDKGISSNCHENVSFHSNTPKSRIWTKNSHATRA